MIVGIDPGNAGAIALLNNDLSLIGIIDMPVMSLNGSKLQVNGQALAQLLNREDIEHGENTHVYIEKVNAMPDQGVTSMFNFGMGYGVIQGVCAGLFIPYFLVSPQSWKKRASLTGKPKGYSRTLAQQLYPEADLSLKKHIGRADALLIARFGSQV